MNDRKQLTTDGRQVTMNTKTCKNPIHVKMECLNKEQSKVNFQLSQKLMCQKVTHLNNATSSLANLEDAEEWFTIDPVTKNVCMYTINNPSATSELDPSIALIMHPCPLHPATGDHKLKATFGHHQTHNEQVIVHPCGIICSRATFYGAEAVSNVLVHASFELFS